MNIIECLGCKKTFDLDRDDLEKQAGFRGTYLVVKCPKCNQKLILSPGLAGDGSAQQQTAGLPATPIERARALFSDAGLAFPVIPGELAAQIKEAEPDLPARKGIPVRVEGGWLFSTRELTMSPYNLEHFVHEGKKAPAAYAVLAHSGHGVNSYAIQYYLVHGPLRMFLHLGWGGVYMDADAQASKIRECFSLADQIVPAAASTAKVGPGKHLTVVGSDFYGSYWSAARRRLQKETDDSRGPAQVLGEVLHWLTT